MSVQLLAPIGRFVVMLLVCTSAQGNTADHSQFEVLQQSFRSLNDVNQACVSCHNTAESQLHSSLHWTWTYDDHTLGKLHNINGYYGNVASNASECGSCHIGYGLSSRTKANISDGPVDCLVCHDTTGDYFYQKLHQDGAECTLCHDDSGDANKARVEQEGKRYTSSLLSIVQSVGKPTIESCGSCHFYDGGSDGAKHGDLDSGLVTASQNQDVHMSTEGANLSCVDCHQGENHQLSGSRYAAQSPMDEQGVSAMTGSRATCVSCHGTKPMKDQKLNDHTDVIACQTCHVPSYARNGIATKTTWNWATAGELDRRRRPITQYDEHGNVTYTSAKGDMTYGENLTPVYQWHNGDFYRSSVGDILSAAPQTSNTLLLTGPTGSENSGKIFPFHQFTSQLPYDTQTNALLPMNLVGRSRDALWNGYDWDKALKAAARAYTDVDYSGDHDFVKTLTFSGLNHGVAPAEQALACESCHQSQGRMRSVTGVYVPGSGQNKWLDQLGWLAVLGTTIGVLGHGLLRWFFSRRRL